MSETAVAPQTWSSPSVTRTPRAERASAVGNPPDDVIARRSRAMSPAKKKAFAVACPLCNAYPYRFCFGLNTKERTILEAFHEKRWETAFAAEAVEPDTVQ